MRNVGSKNKAQLSTGTVSDSFWECQKYDSKKLILVRLANKTGSSWSSLDSCVVFPYVPIQEKCTTSSNIFFLHLFLSAIYWEEFSFLEKWSTILCLVWSGNYFSFSLTMKLFDKEFTLPRPGRQAGRRCLSYSMSGGWWVLFSYLFSAMF